MTAATLIRAASCVELREPNRFCHQCGARITLSPEPAEYKQVTALFADVGRSMNIAAALDMEWMREIMTELVERSAAMARRYGGTVEYTGDGVMALFDHQPEIQGYPQAQRHPVAARYSAAKWSVSSQIAKAQRSQDRWPGYKSMRAAITSWPSVENSWSLVACRHGHAGIAIQLRSTSSTNAYVLTAAWAARNRRHLVERHRCVLEQTGLMALKRHASLHATAERELGSVDAGAQAPLPTRRACRGGVSMQAPTSSRYPTAASRRA